MHSLRGDFKLSLRQLALRTVKIYDINWKGGELTSKGLVFIAKFIFKNDLTVLSLRKP
jgi:hypothetical protein